MPRMEFSEELSSCIEVRLKATNHEEISAAKVAMLWLVVDHIMTSSAFHKQNVTKMPNQTCLTSHLHCTILQTPGSYHTKRNTNELPNIVPVSEATGCPILCNAPGTARSYLPWTCQRPKTKQKTISLSKFESALENSTLWTRTFAIQTNSNITHRIHVCYIW